MALGGQTPVPPLRLAAEEKVGEGTGKLEAPVKAGAGSRGAGGTRGCLHAGLGSSNSASEGRTSSAWIVALPSNIGDKKPRRVADSILLGCSASRTAGTGFCSIQGIWCCQCTAQGVFLPLSPIFQ